MNIEMAEVAVSESVATERVAKPTEEALREELIPLQTEVDTFLKDAQPVQSAQPPIDLLLDQSVEVLAKKLPEELLEKFHNRYSQYLNKMSLPQPASNINLNRRFARTFAVSSRIVHDPLKTAHGHLWHSLVQR